MVRKVEIVVIKPGYHPGDNSEASQAGALKIIGPRDISVFLPQSRLAVSANGYRNPDITRVIWPKQNE